MTMIHLTSAEIRSGSDRQSWAEDLILQLPEGHEGRNSWLLNFGRKQIARDLRVKHQLIFNEASQAVNPPTTSAFVGDRLHHAKQIVHDTVWSSDAKDHELTEIPDDHVLVRVAYAALEFDFVQMVEDFHHHFGINYDGKPRVLDFDIATFRLKFEREEINEWEAHNDAACFELSQRGLFAPDDANLVHHLAAMLDAIADAVYVLLGTAHLQGFNLREAFKRVHRANMAKVKNTNAATAEEAIKLKVTKPPGWQSPRHEDLVEDHAHQ